MHPFGVKMEEPVETKRREHRRRKKLRLDWEGEKLEQCRKMGKKGISLKVLSKNLNSDIYSQKFLTGTICI